MSISFMHMDHSLQTSHTACLASTLGSLLVIGLAPAAFSQVIPDATAASAAVSTPSLVTITGGVRSRNILFHSFDQFSIDLGQTAQFDNALDLSALIARVTGMQPSIIDGTLAAQGSADVFLLNPNGIVFGPTSKLDIGGSFIASTADSILFNNGQQFSAVAPQNAALLTVSSPIGLQYGSRSNEINVLGDGHGFTIDPYTLEVLPTRARTGLLVPAGNTLALLGGGVRLDGGSLTASEGRVVLFGAAKGDTLTLERDPLGWNVQQSNTAPSNIASLDALSLADVALLNASSIFTSGGGGGAVQIEGRRIDLLDGSTILANTYDMQAGRGVVLNATEAINVLGAELDLVTGEALFPTSIFSEVAIDAPGDGGDIQLLAPSILVGDGAQVSTSVFGDGKGGNITVRGETVDLQGGTPEFGSSGFFLSVADPFARGNGGDFTLQANRLRISDGAVIDGSNFGLGDSGQVTVDANRVELIGSADFLGPSGILSQVEGEGNGGNITIRGDVLDISAGASLSTVVFGQGNGGNIDVLVDQISIKDDSSKAASSVGGILSSLESGSQGNGGDINVVTQNLAIADGGEISSLTASDQPAGNVTIQARSVDLVGVDDFSTGIFSSVAAGAAGASGKIDLQTETLTVRNGAQMATGTLGQGNGNNLQVVASAITLDGRNNSGRSGLFASAFEGTGNGGTITVKTDALDIQNGATISASNFPSLDVAIAPGQGAAGSIDITADITRLRNQGTITTSTFTGDQGNIRLESDVILLRNNSAITTNASQSATGGNIRILSDFLLAVPDENSDITADAQQGQGGQVNITAQTIYGLAAHDRLTPSSDITASSDVGLDGEVAINVLAIDPSTDLVPLPNDVADSSDQITAGCVANQGANFVATGRGGLPDDLAQQIQSPTLLPAFERTAGGPFAEGTPTAGNDAVLVPVPAETPPETQTEAQTEFPVEAQSWTVSPDGTVALVAGADVEPGVQVACLERDAA